MLKSVRLVVLSVLSLSLLPAVTQAQTVHRNMKCTLLNQANLPPAMLRLIAAGCGDRASKKSPDTELRSLNHKTLTQLSNEGGYTITALGVSFDPTAINVHGQVVGTPGGLAFLWTQAYGMQILPITYQASATNINASGEVIGEILPPSNDCTPPLNTCNYVFLWTQAGGVESLDTGVPQLQQLIYVTGINNLGEIVGVNASGHAAVWTRAGGIEDLGTLGGSASGMYSEAYAINNIGQIVGVSTLANGNVHAFIWTNASGMQDLGTLVGGDTSYAIDINDHGQVVGSSCIDSPCSNSPVFLWTKAGGMENLGTLPGGDFAIARAINNQGQIVGGACIDSPCYYTHAFLWTKAGGMQDFNELLPSNSVYELTYAFDINYWGQAVGLAMIPNGMVDGVVMTPRK